MFDATTKFPSGILYGSSYDFGNYDECLEVEIPLQDRTLSGKYCMAKFTFNYKQNNTNEMSWMKTEVHYPASQTVWRKINVRQTL